MKSLGRQLLGAAFLVSLPPLGVLAAVSLVVSLRQIEAGLRERLLAGARGAELSLSMALDATRARASKIAADPALVDALAAGQQPALLGFAERALDVIGADRTTILDTRRRVVARGHLPAQYGDVWTEADFDIARPEWGTLHSGTAGVSMFVAVPIFDPQRGVLGTLVTQKAIDHAALLELRSQFGLDFSVWAGEHLQATTLRSIAHVAEADRVRRETSSDPVWIGESHYLARARLKGAELGGAVLLVSLDTAAATVLRYHLLLLYLAVALALVGLSVAGAFLSARRIVRPIRRLAAVADAAARGSLEATIQAEGPREIRELASSFGNMLAKRREVEEELRLTQAELERRVEARTEALRQSEEHLRQARQLEALGRLAGGVAHDFNNVLTTITGNAELLAEDLGSIQAPDSIKEGVREIQQSADHAAAIVRQLMAFSRQQGIAPTVVDLGRAVLDLEKMLLRLCPEDVRLIISADSGLRPILADRTQIGQVLVNLVVNAQDALPSGGTVRVRVYSEDVESESARAVPRGQYTCLEVADDGAGMPAETASRIFEPFFTTKAPGKGTGMGLATVHGIVKQFNAHIDVQSSLGRGTTFRIRFPVTTPAVSPPSPERVHAVQRGVEAVLLCEDEASVRALTASFLRSGGYEVLVAGSGSEALELAARRPDIALLVTDVVMPEMNGVQLARSLRERLPGLKILYVSGYAASVIDSRTDSGAKNQLITKPFTRAELLARVRRALDEPVRANGDAAPTHG